MAPVIISESTYKIQSVRYPNRVIDLRGGGAQPGTPVICYTDDGGDNQKWTLTYVDRDLGIFFLTAADPPSNMFSDDVGPGASISGTPLQRITFVLRASGGANEYQILSPEQSGGHTLALRASDSDTAPITFETQIASATNQQWKFHNLNF